MTTLSVRNVHVDIPTRQGALHALHDLSFDIERGEILGVVGESGAGKSLTGSAVIGLLPKPAHVSSGQILLSGERIDNLSESRYRRIRGKRIGMIFQDPLTSLNPLLRIGDQLVETLQTHHPMSAGAAKNRAIELLDQVGIPAAARRLTSFPHEFSGGMRQRVVIAMALSAGPELIIADEPTTALDVSVQAQIIGLIKRLAQESGVAVMLITHDMSVIAQIADRVAVMYAGRLVEIGSVRAILSRPSHPYTAGLMDSIPTLGAQPHRLRQISGSMPRLTAIPAGCAFNPRCNVAGPPCQIAHPRLYGADGNLVACHRYDPAWPNIEANR